jgi:predicted metalloendopeptidase
MRPVFLALAGLLLAASARGEIDPANFDLSVKPQDDFYQYAIGGWQKRNPIPPAFSRWGAFNEVDDRNKDVLRSLLERAAAATQRNRNQQLAGDFYASGMDEAAIGAAGLMPLQPPLARIAAIKDAADVQAVIAHLHRYGIYPGFYFTSEQDPKDSTRMIAAAGQSGLGLPDRDYYVRTDAKSVELRAQYVAHVERIFILAGDAPDAARNEAQAVMRLETALAQGSRTNVALRDPVANYHKLDLAARQALTPHFDWQLYAREIGLAGDPGEVDVGQPEFFQALDRSLTEIPLPDWRSYLRWHLFRATARYLPQPFVDESFQFYDKTLRGTQQLRERWKRVIDAADSNIGDVLGQLYVAERFPPEAKARILALVGNLRAALRERLTTLEWMDEPTRQKALAKLDAFGVKVGYPDKWIDYSTLTLERGPYVVNVLRARAFNAQRELAKIGRPVDRTEWGMTAPQVNAYYNPSMNEIVFPAGILQPPFFDPQADDAVNYGAIGTVIGHEMTHGFDDQGRKFDAVGNLTEWWTPESARRFEERAKGIVRQFSGYVAVDDLHINGELTQGENIADLGGVKIAYAALQKALAGKPHERIDGFTPEQRFFLSQASAWRGNSRPEALRLQVNTDPHSPAKFRVLGPLSNLDEFAAAFAVPEGAPMRRPKSERVEIW